MSFCGFRRPMVFLCCVPRSTSDDIAYLEPEARATVAVIGDNMENGPGLNSTTQIPSRIR